MSSVSNRKLISPLSIISNCGSGSLVNRATALVKNADPISSTPTTREVSSRVVSSVSPMPDEPKNNSPNPPAVQGPYILGAPTRFSSTLVSLLSLNTPTSGIIILLVVK